MTIPITRHVKIAALANPFNPAWLPYFTHRRTVNRSVGELGAHRCGDEEWLGPDEGRSHVRFLGGGGAAIALLLPDQVHGGDEHGRPTLEKKLKRAQVMQFFVNLPPCVVGTEACAGAHFWARKLQAIGHTVRLMAPQSQNLTLRTIKMTRLTPRQSVRR